MDKLPRYLLFPVIFVLLFGISLTVLGRDSVEDLEIILRDLKRYELGQHQNIIKMQQELKDAAGEKRVPDLTKLKQFATAAGQRTEGYHQAPKHIRDLIDEFEGSTLANIKDSFKLAIATTFGGRVGHAIKVYEVEIDRSGRFIKLLQREQKKISKKIAELQKVSPSPLDLKHSKLDAAIEKLEKEMEHFDVIRRQMNWAYSQADAARSKLAEIYAEVRKLGGEITQETSAKKDIASLCEQAEEVADQIYTHAAELLNDAHAAEKAFQEAKSMIQECKSGDAVQEGLKYNSAGKKLAKDAADSWKKIEEGNNLLKEILKGVPEVRKLRSFITDRSGEIAKLCDKAENYMFIADQALEKFNTLKQTLEDNKGAISRTMEKIRGLFTPDDIRAKIKLDNLQKELMSQDLGDNLAEKINFLMAEARGYEKKIIEARNQNQDIGKTVEDIVFSCENAKMPENATNEAARGLALLGMDDLGKGAEAAARSCLALLEKAGQSPSGVQGEGTSVSGYMATDPGYLSGIRGIPKGEKKEETPELKPVEVKGKEAGSIIGKIFDKATESPMGGVTIHVKGENLDTQLSSQGDGSFTIELPPAEYRLFALLPGGDIAEETSTTVAAGKTSEVVFRLDLPEPVSSIFGIWKGTGKIVNSSMPKIVGTIQPYDIKITPSGQGVKLESLGKVLGIPAAYKTKLDNEHLVVEYSGIAPGFEATKSQLYFLVDVTAEGDRLTGMHSTSSTATLLDITKDFSMELSLDLKKVE